MSTATSLAKWEATLSIAGNLLLATFKFIVAALCHSSALLADSWHTLSDSLSSIVLLLGVRVSERPPDKEHPFGHGRAELIATLIIGTMLAMLGVEFLTTGIQKTLAPEAPSFGLLALASLVLTILIKGAMALFAFHIGSKTGFASVSADGEHHRSDALSSLVLLLGVALGRTFPWTDGVLTILVSAFIFQTAWSVLKTAINQALGEEPTESFLARLHALGSDCLGPQSHLHHIHVHHYGTHHEVTFHATLPGTISLAESHTAVTHLEERIHTDLGYDATIHIEPYGDTQ